MWTGWTPSWASLEKLETALLGISLLHHAFCQTYQQCSHLSPAATMVAIRCLFLAGACAGLSAAAQVGLAASYVLVPAGCNLDICCTLDDCAYQALASNQHTRTQCAADQARGQPAAGHPTTTHWRRPAGPHGGCTACARHACLTCLCSAQVPQMHSTAAGLLSGCQMRQACASADSADPCLCVQPTLISASMFHTGATTG